MNTIGHFFLNFSTCLYLIWFVPQILLNFKRKNTQGLSLLMCSILFISYFTDLLYGFGLKMQWQYRLVTIVGLFCLTLQHFQFAYYGLGNNRQKYIYYTLSFIYCILFYCCIQLLLSGHHSRNFYDSIGVINNICSVSYTIPQLIKNYLNQSTLGLSLGFIVLAMGLNLCDEMTAWLLHWDYPSKIGPIITFTGNCLLFLQIHYYEKHFFSFATVAAYCKRRFRVTSKITPAC